MTGYKWLLCFFLIPAFFLAGCARGTKLEEINFKDTVELEETKPLQGTGINICVGSMITPEEGYSYYKKLLDYLGKKLNLKVNFIDRKSYAEVNALLEKGRVDLAFICGGPYVEGHDKFGLELLVAPVIRGKTIYYSYIIVKKTSGIKKLEDLKGQVFAFVDPLSNTGKLVPDDMLRKIGETPESFFKEYLYTYSHDNSIKAVANDVVDGAAVDSLVWEYLNKIGSQDIQQTKIIKISNPYGIPPVVTRPGLDRKLKTKIKDILLKMDRDIDGKKIIKEMLIDRFVETDDSNYNSIRKIKAGLGK